MKQNKLLIHFLLVFFLINSYSINQVFIPNKVYKNCSALNKEFPGGVALPGAKNKGGKTKKSPVFDKKLYEMNKKSDRDNDGIACEK